MMKTFAGLALAFSAQAVMLRKEVNGSAELTAGMTTGGTDGTPADTMTAGGVPDTFAAGMTTEGADATSTDAPVMPAAEETDSTHG